MYNDEFSMERLVGMCIDVIRLAMGCPACMAHSYMTANRPARNMLFKITDFAFAFIYLSRSIENRNTGRIIPTVFKTLEAIDKNGICFAVAYIANNSAHFNRDLGCNNSDYLWDSFKT